MNSPNRHFILLALTLLLIIGACKDQPRTRILDRDRDQPVGYTTGDVGTANIVYDYSTNLTPGWSTVVHAVIPVVIERDPDNKYATYRVIGGQATIYYITVQGGGGPTGECFINCDIPGLATVQGKMSLNLVEGKPNCVFSLTISGDYEAKDAQRSGTCVQEAVEGFDCVKVLALSIEDLTVELDKDKKVATPKPAYDATVDYRVEIKDVELPPDVGCEWE